MHELIRQTRGNIPRYVGIFFCSYGSGREADRDIRTEDEWDFYAKRIIETNLICKYFRFEVVAAVCNIRKMKAEGV